MKAVMKKAIVIALALCLILPRFELTAYASPANEFSNEAIYAGMIVSSVMQTIVEEYKGSDIDYDALVNAALHGIGEALDPYSYYMSQDEYASFTQNIVTTRALFGIGFIADENGNIVVSEVMDGSSAKEEGIKLGDILVSANGVLVEGFSVSEAIEQLNNFNEKKASAVFKRNDVEISVLLEKRELPNKTVYLYTLDELMDIAEPSKVEDIRLLYIYSVGGNTHNELKAIIEEIKAQGVTKIILDLRDNEGGYFETAIDILHLLVEKGPILLRSDKKSSLVTYYSALQEAPFEEIVVLINQNTASAAEMIAVCLQDKGSVVFGQKSYGKGFIQSVYSAYDGVIKFTTGEYLSPAGKKVEGIGVQPDIKIEFPKFLNNELSVTSEDIIGIKNILRFCGLPVGQDNAEYDEITKATVLELKKSFGMGGGDVIDAYFKEALNGYYAGMFATKDVVVEKAYEFIINK